MYRNATIGRIVERGRNAYFGIPRKFAGEAYPNCPNSAKTCMYIHPDVDSAVAPTGSAATPQSRRKSTPLCKFYPNCTNPSCPFLHQDAEGAIPPYGAPLAPVKPAPAPATTKVPIPCRDGSACTRTDCHFLHPWDNKFGSTPCKFGAGCTRSDCAYKHSPRPLAHRNRTAVFNQPHVSERSFSVADEGIVERIPVPNNAVGAAAMMKGEDADVMMDG
ncbi:hypothetical protein BC937DRAFT_90648 [Endogone sp. FLAS-F59071]|nr:hypothetical protein BC937DRAFT_90648 [Endogone sp. FLAS-F59071]|eukprot:RUS22017.1 hypothetical protein BC937DRAFT_90648 [Endogone sp. FLAS-F59071]